LFEAAPKVRKIQFECSATTVDIEALAARYQNEDFWRRSLIERDDDTQE
jgi:hypothetical protein